MKSVIGIGVIAWYLGYCVMGGLTAEAQTNVPPPSQLEQALADLSSETEGTRDQAVRVLIIEQGDAALLPRLEELRANADRSLRMAIKPVADAWRHRMNLASPDADTRRSAATDLGTSGRPAAIPWLEAAAVNESHRWVRYAMEESALLLHLASDNPTVKQQAVAKLGDMRSQNAVPALKELVQAGSEGTATEPQKTLAQAATIATERIESWRSRPCFAASV
jgi:urea transport system permease protein